MAPDATTAASGGSSLFDQYQPFAGDDVIYFQYDSSTPLRFSAPV
jgi:hypothetical protein